AGAAAADAAVRRAAAEATQDRLRFLMRLDHELKNPLTAIRAGLANIDPAGAAVADGTSAALASVSAQADRITRLVSDLRKLADLEIQEIETAPVDLPGLLHEVAEAVAEIPGASQRTIRVTVPRAPWPLPLIEGDRDLLFIALQNLVANAVKFSAPGDTTAIRPAWRLATVSLSRLNQLRKPMNKHCSAALVTSVAVLSLTACSARITTASPPGSSPATSPAAASSPGTATAAGSGTTVHVGGSIDSFPIPSGAKVVESVNYGKQIAIIL